MMNKEGGWLPDDIPTIDMEENMNIEPGMLFSEKGKDKTIIIDQIKKAHSGGKIYVYHYLCDQEQTHYQIFEEKFERKFELSIKAENNLQEGDIWVHKEYKMPIVILGVDHETVYYKFPNEGESYRMITDNFLRDHRKIDQRDLPGKLNLEGLANGIEYRRQSWNKDEYLVIEHEMETERERIAVETVLLKVNLHTNEAQVWMPTIQDLLADDWVVME